MKLSRKLCCAATFLLCAHSPLFAVEAPQVSVSHSLLSWPSIDAIGINVHGNNGVYLETIAGDATSWKAPDFGSYFIVSTDLGDWQGWGKSNVVVVSDPNTQINDELKYGTSPTLIIDNYYAAVYSSTSMELFWEYPYEGDFIIELFRDDGQMNKRRGSSFYQSNLKPGKTYKYRLRAFDSAGLSSPSVYMEVTMPDANNPGSASPSTPTRFVRHDDPTPTVDVPSLPKSVRHVEYNNSRAELFWLGTADDSVQNYTIYKNGGEIGQTTGNAFYMNDLSPGTTYDFVVSNNVANGIPIEAARTSFTTGGVSPTVSTGRPAGTLETFNFAGWDDIPGYAQSDYPSDCLWALRLADEPVGLIDKTEPVCFSPARRDLIRAGYPQRGSGFAYPAWSFKLPGQNSSNHIEGLAWYSEDEFTLVTDVTTSFAESSYEISRFGRWGAFIGTLPILSSIETSGGAKPRMINLDGVDLSVSMQKLTDDQARQVGSDTEYGLRVVGEYFEARDGRDTSTIQGWDNMGAFVALVNPIDGSTLEQRFFPGRTAFSIELPE